MACAERTSLHQRNSLRRRRDDAQLPHQPERVVPAAVIGHSAPGEAMDADAGHDHRLAGRRDAQHLPAMGATEPPPSRHLVAFGDLLLDRHLRVRERGMELSEEVLEGLCTPQRLTQNGEGNTNVRSSELIDQAQIPWNPGLDEPASKRLVVVCRHGLLPGWWDTSLNSTGKTDVSSSKIVTARMLLCGLVRWMRRVVSMRLMPGTRR